MAGSDQLVHYTFFLLKYTATTAPPFIIEILDTTTSASDCASLLLKRWPEYDFIEVLCDDRIVTTVHRDPMMMERITIPRVWPVRGSAPLH